MEGGDVKDWGLGGISVVPWQEFTTGTDKSRTRYQPVAGNKSLWHWAGRKAWFTDGTGMRPVLYRSRKRARRIARNRRWREHAQSIRLQRWTRKKDES